MRPSILIPICFAFTASANAQNSISTASLSPPRTTPIDGWAADNYQGQPQSILRDMLRARHLVAEARYAEADPLLNKLMGRTDSRGVRFLKAVTALGLGNATAARRFFEKALPSGRSGDPGALSGLAIAEIQLGNADAARRILRDLRDQQERCQSDCDRAEPLERAIAVVERALI